MQETNNEIINLTTDERDVVQNEITKNDKNLQEKESYLISVEELSNNNNESLKKINSPQSPSVSFSESQSSVLKTLSFKFDNNNIIDNLTDVKFNSSGIHENNNNFNYEKDKDIDVNEDINSYLPSEIRLLQDGLDKGLQKTSTQDIRPEWFDINKFKKGQEFAMKYYFGVNFAEMLSLLILFSFDDGFQPLIFTDQSGTPYTSFKRYLSTVLRVKSWFENDVFDTNSIAYYNIKIVRSMHESISKKMNSLNVNDIDDKINRLLNEKNLKCSLKNSIKEDFKSSCPFNRIYQRKTNNRILYFNQCSMSITQFGFIGLVITYPDKFGAANATDEEMEGFIHLWKTIGYLLGIEDKYNFCNGSLIDVRNRCKDLINYCVLPSFCNITNEWEHFSRCLVKGVSFYVPGNTFEISILYLCYVLNIKAKKIYSSISWLTYFRLQIFKFTLCFALRFPILLNLANKSVKSALSRAKNFSNEKLEELGEISDEFMK
ncbi:uncharacterized protein LOC142332369 isoform X1 [Lycorma delicatula]|uniref:uncharacterized protein LOC142332369 isoform X1 n=1 Tax=Lycorma delicatula TaxID=130591 RepID=UPI003F50E327